MCDPRRMNLYLLPSGRVIMRDRGCGVSRRYRIAGPLATSDAAALLADRLFIDGPQASRFIVDAIGIARDGRPRLPHRAHMALVAIYRERLRKRLATERVGPDMLEAA